MSSDRVTTAVATFVAAAAELADLDSDRFTHTELLELLEELETVSWRLGMALRCITSTGGPEMVGRPTSMR